MNNSVLSETFGEQLAAITTGTRYAVEADSNNFISELEHRIRQVMYSLWMDAQAKRLADYLARKITTHFEQLYEFSYGVPIYDQEVSASRGTESIALMIIDEKNRYMKRIEYLRGHYKRFNNIVEELDGNSKRTIVGYFKHGEKVDYETLRGVLRKNLKFIELIYKTDEQEKESEVDGLEVEYQEGLGKQRYVIDRKTVYMFPEEYKAYTESRNEERKKLYERLGISL